MKTFIQICRELKDDQYAWLDFYLVHGRIVNHIYTELTKVQVEILESKDLYECGHINL